MTKFYLFMQKRHADKYGKEIAVRGFTTKAAKAMEKQIYWANKVNARIWKKAGREVLA